MGNVVLLFLLCMQDTSNANVVLLTLLGWLWLFG